MWCQLSCPRPRKRRVPAEIVINRWELLNNLSIELIVCIDDADGSSSMNYEIALTWQKLTLTSVKAKWASGVVEVYKLSSFFQHPSADMVAFVEIRQRIFG